MTQRVFGRPSNAKGPESSQQVKGEEAEDALRARAVDGSPDAAVSEELIAADNKPAGGVGGGGGAGETGDVQVGSQEVGGDRGANAPGDKAEEGGKENSSGKVPLEPGSTAAGGAGEGADAASSSVDPQEVRRVAFSSFLRLPPLACIVAQL